MPPDVLLFALIAAGLIFWLRSILGTKNDEDDNHKRPNMFEGENTEGLMKPKDNVVTLNASAAAAGLILPRHVKIDNKTTENALEDIMRDNPRLDLLNFAEGAEGAFSIIVEAFADGDLETLEGLLAPEVYSAFETAVKDRSDRGEKVETEIKAIEKMDITEVKLKDEHIFITVRFSARETCVIRDKEGEIISGDPDSTTMMVDVWVFGKELSSTGPEWFLYETRDDEVEDHKTPLPEGGSDKEKK